MRSTGSPIASECTPRRYATGSVKQRSTAGFVRVLRPAMPIGSRSRSGRRRRRLILLFRRDSFHTTRFSTPHQTCNHIMQRPNMQGYHQRCRVADHANPTSPLVGRSSFEFGPHVACVWARVETLIRSLSDREFRPLTAW